MKKRMLALLLAFALLFTNQSNVNAQDFTIHTYGDLVEETEKLPRFETNHDAEDSLAVEINGNQLIFKSFPFSEEYSYGKIGFNGRRNVYPLEPNLTLSLPQADGVYYLEVYRGKARYGMFEGYLWGKNVGIKVTNGVASFLNSPVLEYNQKVYSKNSKTNTALGYYLLPSHLVESDADEIKKMARNIVSETDSDYQKVRKVHDWVAQNIWYDYDCLNGKSKGVVNALDVLRTRKSVCQGYADLSAALLRAVGVPTRVVSGYVTQSEWTTAMANTRIPNHAWNEAYVDGQWLMFDATWDSNNAYENGVFSTGTGMSDRLFFNPTMEWFSKTHKIMPEDNADLREKGNYLQKAIVVPGNLKVTMGKYKKLSVKVKGNVVDLADAKITYAAKTKHIATVNSKGEVKGKKKGLAIIETKIELEGVLITYRTLVKVKKK